MNKAHVAQKKMPSDGTLFQSTGLPQFLGLAGETVSVSWLEDESGNVSNMQVDDVGLIQLHMKIAGKQAER